MATLCWERPARPICDAWCRATCDGRRAAGPEVIGISDLRLAVRRVLRKRSLLYGAITSLGLGMGGVVVSYELLDALLLHPFPEVQAPERVVVYQLALSEILQGPAVPLIDGDRVFVAVSSLTRWERFWKKILPFDTVFRTGYRTAVP